MIRGRGGQETYLMTHPPSPEQTLRLNLEGSLHLQLSTEEHNSGGADGGNFFVCKDILEELHDGYKSK